MADSSSPKHGLAPEDERDLRALKARYFRAVDTKNWDLLLGVFCDDAEFVGFAFSAPGARGFVDGVSAYLDGVESIHHGFTPEFCLVGSGRVRGIWVMEDYLFWPIGSRGYKGIEFPDQWGIRGFGHYEEEYRRVDGVWKISFMRLSRLRVEPLRGHGAQVPAYSVDRLLSDWL